MSLLFLGKDNKIKELADKIFHMQFKQDRKLSEEYDERRKRLMYEDILYNLECLRVAVRFEEPEIFNKYAIWIYELLCNIMGDVSRERIKEHMVVHYKLMDSCLEKILEKSEHDKYSQYIQNGIKVTEDSFLGIIKKETLQETLHVNEKNNYLQLLLDGDTKGAVNYIKNLYESGIDIKNIYIDIIQNAMFEIGELWHSNVISVDKEHYSSSITQGILSQFYPVIFNTQKNGYKILTCCVGSELHELGARMLSDVFEYSGWDSIYLGASVPTNAIINAINENKPDLIALSVTMPHHLIICEEVIKAIRKEFGDIFIAAGGRAFHLSENSWKKFDVDVSTDNAVQLLEWADENIVKNGR